MLLKLFSIFLFTANFQPMDYREVWGEDYSYAVEFVEAHCEIFTDITTEHNIAIVEAIAIVFPELLRYSLIRDFLETIALEVGYVTYGKGYGDFSVGPFQIKPSFIEHLEDKVCDDERLMVFQPLFTYYASDSRGIRKERINRLQNIAFQIQYLACFISIAMLEYDELECMSANERVKMLATLYNVGLGNTMDTIKKLSKRCTFPYGSSYLGTQYSYATIASDYYLKNEM